jgi:hypothetical protein
LSSHSDESSRGNPRSSESPIGLLTPARKAPKSGGDTFSPKHMERWFAALPMANIGESSRQVFKRLVEFNRTEIPVPERAKIAESFRQPVEYLTRNLQRHYLFLGMPLSPKSRKIAALAKELNAELGASYKILVEDIVSGHSSRYDRKQLIIGLHRALNYLGRVLLQTTLVYSPQPPNLWREMHAIYAYAMQHELHDTLVRDGDKAGPRDSSIEELYKALVLFAVSSPNRLRQTQIQQLARQVQGWARRIRLVGSSERGLRLGQFAVDLWSDTPPVHKSLLERRSPKRIKTFDLRGLLQDVKQEFERAPQDETREAESCELSRSLLRRLILSWSKTREREFARTRLNFELTVKVGLAAIHQHIAGTEAPVHHSTAPAPRLAAEWQSPEDQTWSESLPNSLSLSPIDSQLSRGSSAHRRRAPSVQKPKAKSSVTDWLSMAEEQRNESYLVSTSNESAGGYCIQWPAAKNSKVRIGEILGIQTGSDRNQLSLGAVRWLEQVPGDDLILGVHIIAQRCAVGRLFSSKDEKNSARQEYRCILLPEDDAGDRYSGLLLQAAEVPPGADMLLVTEAGAEPIRLTRVVESTGSFTHIQFTYVKDKVPNKIGTHGNDDGFEDLWGNI